jgi:glucose/arabinose dehydrogenase
MPSLRPQFLIGTAVAAALLLPAAVTAQAPPPPTAVNGNPVTVVATGVTTPTAFAFTGDTIFAASGPAEDPSNHGPTGLFTLAGGKATQVPGTPPVVSGLAWHGGKLYVSAFTKIVAYSGWDGTKFASSKTVTSGLKGGYNGIAFGPDNRLYAGISFREKFDPGGDPSPHAQSVVSMTATGKNLKTVATGLRQPFQLNFPQGSKYPYVGVLGQEKGKIPEDAIVVAKPGVDYGYPKCQFGFRCTCMGFTKPLISLP